MRHGGDKDEKGLELWVGLFWGQGAERHTQAHFENQRYFKGEMQENPGNWGIGILRVLVLGAGVG